MYCAKNYGSNYSGILKLAPSDGAKTECITDFKQEYGSMYQALLSQKIEDIFTPYEADNPHGIFTQCEDEQHCSYCDFLTFCRRHPDQKDF
jgi:hypothetical protein